MTTAVYSTVVTEDTCLREAGVVEMTSPENQEPQGLATALLPEQPGESLRKPLDVSGLLFPRL